MDSNQKPNLIIPGAQKSGTSTLVHSLCNHSQIYLPEDPVPNWFVESNVPSEDFYAPYSGPQARSTQYRLLKKTHFMWYPEVPEKLFRTIGSSLKFIILLRDPVERALSAYWHYVERLDEQRSLNEVFLFDATQKKEVIREETRKIERAIESGKLSVERVESKQDQSKKPFQYVKNSFYSSQIDRFLSVFDRDDFLLVPLERFVGKPEEFLKKLGRFLDLDSEEFGSLEHRNTTQVPVGGYVGGFLHDLLKPILRPFFKNFSFGVEWYKSIGFQTKPEVPTKIRTELRQIFEEEVSKLDKKVDFQPAEIWDYST